MQLKNKFNKGFRFLLCAIDIFSKYAWLAPLKDKKSPSFINAFQKILDKSGRKPKKIWPDKGSEFYNSSFKKWLKDNDVEVYSIWRKISEGKENQLSLKDLLEHQRLKSVNTWLGCQKMGILIN